MPPRILTLPKIETIPAQNVANTPNVPGQAPVITGPLKKEGDFYPGKDLKIQSTEGITREVTDTENAEAAAKAAAEAIENTAIQGVIDSYVAKGVPITDITAPMLFVDDGIKKLGLTNIGKIKDLLETTKLDKQEKASQTLKTQIEQLLYRANAIPSESHAVGKFVQGPINATVGFSGYLPEKGRFDGIVKQTLGSMARTLGEVGNLNEDEQIRMKQGLEDLASPQIEIRKQAKQDLMFLFDSKGLKIKLDPYYKIKQKYDAIEKELLDQEQQVDPTTVNTGGLNQQVTGQKILTPEQEKRAQKLLNQL